MSDHLITSGSCETSSFVFVFHDAKEPGLISRRQLHDELLGRVRDLILNGGLSSGEKIPEKELCGRFGVSRTPLREALKVLAYEGLVVLNHNRGAIVKPLTLQDITEAFPIYGRLEALAGELACNHLSTAEVDELKSLHDKLIGYYKRGDRKGFTATNEKIHARLQTASHNHNLVRLIRCVSSRVSRTRLSITVPETRLTAAVSEHERIIAAVEKRDGCLLSQAIRDHIENTFSFFKEALATPEATPARKHCEHLQGAPGLA